MTRINYDDLTKYSPSGTLRLEVKSPDNQPFPTEDPDNFARHLWGGFQKDFTYTVVDNRTDSIVWQRNPDKESDIDKPVDAWVSDEGHVIVITRGPFSSSLFCLDESGDISLSLDVGKEVLDDEKKLHWTSAGPHWNVQGIGTFHSINNLSNWSFRTRIGDQVVVNLHEARLASFEDFKEPILAAQAEWAMNVLSVASEDSYFFTPEVNEKVDLPRDLLLERLDLRQKVYAALLIVAADKIQSAIPYLQRFEESHLIGSSQRGWSTAKHKRTYLNGNCLVSLAKMSMRCLNHQPLGAAGYQLVTCGEDESRIHVPAFIPNRDELIETLTTGLTKHEVALLLGMPDYVGNAWHYDILMGDESCTWVLEWNRDEMLSSIERQAPAWQDPYDRAIFF